MSNRDGDRAGRRLTGWTKYGHFLRRALPPFFNGATIPRRLDGSEMEIRIAAGIAICAYIDVLVKELGQFLT